MGEDYSFKKRLVLSFHLSFISGFIDIMGFVLAGNIFLSFMSGNSTIFANGVVRFDGEIILQYALVILMFVLGSFLGDLITSKFKKKIDAIIFFEIGIACLIFFLSIVTNKWYLFLLFAIMMGMQNSIHITVAGVEMSKNFYTGTLQKLGISFSQMFQKKQNSKASLLLIFCWVSLFSGALVSGFLINNLSLSMLMIIIVGLLVSLLLSVRFLK